MWPKYPERNHTEIDLNNKKQTNIQKKLLSPESLDNLGEKNEDLKLSEPLADAHAGALAKGKAHKRMNCLLKQMIH